ncbi:baseplate J-like protein [Clostridium puniceum]|uniref:Baseplate J-like protein n=1 Tax=Clostridium puniceum TaxID=29367 RepID=A0A1S8T5F8_9CLOT|nr:baseplate J/gp47 family protein [Clostridium puniceum]OOM72928.1 baseplate J-like protein [Clostridium puniceum]
MDIKLTIPDYLKETENDVHKRMIDNAPDNICTVEGDLFWDNTKPAASEIARTKNIAMLNILKSRFVQTAMDEDLDLIGEEDGIPRKQASNAIQLIQIMGTPEIVIPKGSIFATVGTKDEASIEFQTKKEVTIDSTGTATIEAQCLTTGTIGNVAIGNITVLGKSINGIQKISNIEIIQKGVEKESNDDYRYRIILKAQAPATSGNEYHYKNWALEVVGVGAVKIKSLWDKNNGMNGNGSVKVVIADSDRHAVTEGLITETFNHIEEERPIGATVTVVSATEKAINVTANIKLATGFTIAQVQASFIELLENSLKSVAFNETYISINKLGNILFNVTGVMDHLDFKINGLAANIPLEDEEIAVIGIVDLGVIF